MSHDTQIESSCYETLASKTICQTDYYIINVLVHEQYIYMYTIVVQFKWTYEIDLIYVLVLVLVLVVPAPVVPLDSCACHTRMLILIVLRSYKQCCNHDKYDSRAILYSIIYYIPAGIVCSIACTREAWEWPLMD